MFKRLTLVFSLAFALVGCGGLKSKEKEIATEPVLKESDAFFEGSYEVEAKEYKATLVISGLDEGYKLKWKSKDEVWYGSGFAFQDVLASESGAGPGFFGIFKKDGKKLSGIFAYLDGSGYFTERSTGTLALRPAKTELDGTYSVIGFFPDGEGYEETMNLERRGETCRVTWGPKDAPHLTGAGIVVEDFFISGVGVGGSIVIRIYTIDGKKLDGIYYYTYYDEEESKEHLVWSGEIAEREE
ncbi:MAG: hypothetical protein JW724_08230 [Candidatus Altiarchaeota archaeon]|nr:hypothetical protein [Candidatus Altiarchaeota archaeon]